MNDELQKQLADMLAKLSAAAEHGATWAGDQIPPLVQEKILLGRIESVITAVLFVGILYIGVRFLQYCHRLQWDVDDHGQIIPATIFGGILIVFGVVGTLINLHVAALAFFAPRLYIVEWLVGLAHGTS